MRGRECLGRRTWMSSRWDHRLRTPAFGPVLNPWDTGRVPGGPREGRRRLWPGVGPLRNRDRYRGVDPAAGGALRDRRVEADLWGDLALRDDRLRFFAGSVWAAHPGRDRRGAASLRAAGAGPLRLDLGRDRGWGGGAQPRGPEGAALRGAAGAGAGRGRARSARGLREDAGDDRAARRRGRGGAAAPRRARDLRLLRDRPGRGVVEPRPLRRRPLRDAGGDRRRPGRDV